MVWVLVFAAIAVGGIVWLIAWTVWLAHKASDLFSEFEMLGQRAEEFADLVGQVTLPQESGLPSTRSGQSFSPSHEW